MFFCAGFFHCFLIVNQTENGCKQKCGGLNARIPGPTDYIHFDYAREFLEKRRKSKREEKAKLPKSERNLEIQLPGDQKQNRLYTDFFFNFTSKQWINAQETYNHSDIPFISTSYTHGVGRASDQQCQEILQASLHVVSFEGGFHFRRLKTIDIEIAESIRSMSNLLTF